MVIPVLNFSRRGLLDFVIQRASAFIMAAYVFVLLWFFSANELSHQALVNFFLSTPMKIFSALTILSILGHAWVGLWTIGTDYIQRAHFEFSSFWKK